MRNKIKRNIYLNILCYLNNFIYLFVTNNIEIKGFMEFWNLLPFVFFTATSVLMETKYHKEHLYIKKYAIIDWTLRILGAFPAFSYLNLSFKEKVILTSIFFILNTIIEIIMLNKKDEMIHNENNTKKKKYKVDNSNIAKLQCAGFYSYIVICVFIGIVTTIYGYRGMSIKIVFLMILVFLIFAIVEYKKITGYYLEKHVRRKFIIRNIVPFGLGVLIYLGEKIVFGMKGYDISWFILILCMCPSIETTRDIGVKSSK